MTESQCRDIAQGLFRDILITWQVLKPGPSANGGPDRLDATMNETWQAYAMRIPEKLKSFDFDLRSFSDFCATCIITDDEVSLMADFDMRLFGFSPTAGLIILGENTSAEEAVPADTARQFFIELNYLIPRHLKLKGFEIARSSELRGIDRVVVKKIARAIHSKYRMDYPSAVTGEFDDLSEYIRQSNYDSAYNLPAKLLSAGYTIRPAAKGHMSRVPEFRPEEVETMARVEHMRWCWEKRLNGWIFGPVRDDKKKTHPSLVPYEELSESEKRKDRELVRHIPSLLRDIGYETVHVNPEKIKGLPYALEPRSGIHKILDEIRDMNSNLRSLVQMTPELESKLKLRNSRIEEAVAEIKDSYDYARHIQGTFLPDALYVRECFPESFVLFLPRDIVSGDFYFFSRKKDLYYIAIADCTGHGIPGALITTIGYGLIDQAVNELSLEIPSEILCHLYTKLHRFLRHNSDTGGVPDDMDIVVCVYDKAAGSLTYSGVKMPLCVVSGGLMYEYRSGDPPGVDGGKSDYSFKDETISLNSGDTVYLFSDGYPDQFGSKDHRKFGNRRFRDLLMAVSELPMTEQSDRLFDEIEAWKSARNEDQTDDILVAGLRI